MDYRKFLYCVDKAVKYFQNKDQPWLEARQAIEELRRKKDVDEDELNKATEKIFKFLKSWNKKRFDRLKKEKEKNFKDYETKLKEGIKALLKNELEGDQKLKDLTYLEAYNFIKSLLKPAEDVIDEDEHIAPAKLLMLFYPEKFIAWDIQIAKLFSLNHRKPEHYNLFNILIENFIHKNAVFMKFIEDEYSYPIRRILDMILWLKANNKLMKDLCFEASTSELIKSICEI